MMGLHCIKAWSSTQGAVALSIAEAEFYAMTRGLIEGLFIQNLLKEVRRFIPLRLHSDSSAARGMAGRLGAGRRVCVGRRLIVRS